MINICFILQVACLRIVTGRRNQFRAFSGTNLRCREREREREDVAEKKTRQEAAETSEHVIAHDEGMMDEGAVSLRDRDMIARRRGGPFVHRYSVSVFSLSASRTCVFSPFARLLVLPPSSFPSYSSYTSRIHRTHPCHRTERSRCRVR